MTAAHISRSTRQYHSELFTPTEASAKVFQTGPKSDPVAHGWLGASLREIWRRFPTSECRAWKHPSPLCLFWLLSNASQRLGMWEWIRYYESCFRSSVFARWTGAVATTEKPHETRSCDARRTPEKSLGNCVTESAAVHLTSSFSRCIVISHGLFMFTSVSKSQRLCAEMGIRSRPLLPFEFTFV